MSGNRHRVLGGGGQHVLDYLKRMQAENQNFYYEVQIEADQSIGNMFWADAASRLNFNYFGDAVKLDMSYRENRHRVPLAYFSGINHHGQPVLFGCALLVDESESDFLWLFQSWLRAMSGRYPVTITTEPDRILQMAVRLVLPQTRHRLCKNGIFKETKEKLAPLYQSHPTFETEFHKCIDDTDSIQEFESCWSSLLERYYVMDNEWLQSMYGARQHWVPVYLRDSFFGEIFATEKSEGSFFDGFFNAATTFQLFFLQYERAISSWHEKELKADYDTNNMIPILKTPSPMEKQAANIYTKRIFLKFQEELVETLANPATKVDDCGTMSTYRVAKFGEEHKAHTVRLMDLEMKASCTCQLFDFSGIICRHILAVFRAKNVLMLPPHYILKRWTRKAKTGSSLDEHGSEGPISPQESGTVRYNNLRQEAIKYVEEGAKSIHIYKVAMDALQEAGKKVAALKNQSRFFTQGIYLTNGSSQEVSTGEANQTTSSQSMAEKEKKIRELTAELDSINQKSEFYRTNLLSILHDVEDQKSKMSVKVQNSKLSLKE
uniref:Protein FAR1-RELATED SEQUENCE n=1 Tax=Kalanchoe fedtschenkoi TaxID=63787 RepID=A0A7N0U4U0_KALFE